MTFIVGFNGPPESGKDTMAEMFLEHCESQHIMVPTTTRHLNTPLRKVAFTLVGETYETVDYEGFKRTDYKTLGMTGRQLMISVSESFLKPIFGAGVMAKLLVESINQGYPGIVTVPDSGFQCEMDPLIEAYGANNVYIVQVRRNGKDFQNDSREWVMHPNPKHNMIVHNNGTLDDLRVEAGRLYGRLVNQRGWKL